MNHCNKTQSQTIENKTKQNKTNQLTSWCMMNNTRRWMVWRWWRHIKRQRLLPVHRLLLRLLQEIRGMNIVYGVHFDTGREYVGWRWTGRRRRRWQIVLIIIVVVIVFIVVIIYWQQWGGCGQYFRFAYHFHLRQILNGQLCQKKRIISVARFVNYEKT